MTARLVKRNWSSTLQASDFSQGAAKYVTEVVDETLVERKVTSAKDAQKLDFEAKDAGVYLVAARSLRQGRPPAEGQRRFLRRRRDAGDVRKRARARPPKLRPTRKPMRPARPRP